MLKERLTAFSDGVIAIIITIMVLELKAPHENTLRALAPLAPTFLAYALSFAYIAIYWNNHHHLFQATRRISGGILWANTHLLFWLSLVPFSTAWLSETNFARAPVALYGLGLLAPAIAYYYPVARLDPNRGARPESRRGHRRGLEGLDLNGVLRLRRGAGLRRALRVDGALCARRGDVVHPRPAHRRAPGSEDEPD